MSNETIWGYRVSAASQPHSQSARLNGPPAYKDITQSEISLFIGLAFPKYINKWFLLILVPVREPTADDQESQSDLPTRKCSCRSSGIPKRCSGISSTFALEISVEFGCW
jgi:hypothetical protein